MLNQSEETRAGSVDLDVAKTDQKCDVLLGPKIKFLALQMDSKGWFFRIKYEATEDFSLHKFCVLLFKEDNEYYKLCSVTCSLSRVLEKLYEVRLDRLNRKERTVLEKVIEKLEVLDKIISVWNSYEEQFGSEFVSVIKGLLQINEKKLNAMVDLARYIRPPDSIYWDCVEEEFLTRKLDRMIKNSLNTQMKYLGLQMEELGNMLCKTQSEIFASETKEQLTSLTNDLCTQLEQLSVFCFNIQEKRTLQNEITKLEDLSKIACNWYKCEHQSGIEFLDLVIKLLDINRNKFGTMLLDKTKGKNHSDRDHQWDFQSLNSQEAIMMRKLKEMIPGSRSLPLPLCYSSGQAIKEPGVSTDCVVYIHNSSKTVMDYQGLAHEHTTFLEFCLRAMDCPPELRVNLGLAFYAMLLGQLWAMGNPLDKLSKSASITEGTQASILSLRQAFSMFLPITMWSAMFFWTFIGTALLVRSMPFKGPLVFILLLSLAYYVSVFASTVSGLVVHCGSIRMPSLLFASGGATSFALLIGFAVTIVLWLLHSKLGKTVESVNLD